MPAQKQMVDLIEELNLVSSLAMTHPSGKPLNHQSSKDIKKQIKQARRLCEYCREVESKDVPFKTCAKCQSSFYCSKECQKLDWPDHKERCGPTRRQKRLEKLATTLTANEDLFDFLKVAIALHLDLVNGPPPDKPFNVLVPLMVEPEDILDFARLQGRLEPRETNLPEKMKGMLQIGGILPCPTGLLSDEALLELTSNTRAERDTMESEQGSAVGVIVFVLGNMMDTRASIDAPVLIPSHVMDIARKAQPFTQIVLATDDILSQPMDEFSCIEYINTSIRWDKKNVFLLRSEMLASDKQIVRTSATNFDRFLDVNFGCVLIQRRMQHEYIYTPLQQNLG